MKYLLPLLLFLSTVAYGQPRSVPFGATRTIDTSKTVANMQFNGVLVAPSYATSDTTKFFGINSIGQFVLRTVTGGGSTTDTTSLSDRINLRELLSNKATSFATINNTLYPSVAAVNTQINTSLGSYVPISRFTDSLAAHWLAIMTLQGAFIDSVGILRALANTKQPQLNGAGFVKTSGTTISYDNSTYLTTAVTSVGLAAGAGMSIGGSSPITTTGVFTVTNTAPDQTVSLTSGTGISATGIYPNFTITNTSPSSGGTVTSVGATAGTGIQIAGTSPITGAGTYTVTNSAPDQTVTIGAGTGISVAGSYPTYTVTNSSPSSGGTVTTVNVTTANGFAGLVATGGTTPAITLTTTVNGIPKGNGTAFTAATSGTDYSMGTAALLTGILKTTTSTGNLSVAVAGTDFQSPLTLGNFTEATSSVLTILGGTGAIVGSGLAIQVKAASGSQAGYLPSADWTTFNNKQSTSLTSGNIWVGSTGNVATGTPMSGDATMPSTGIITLATSGVTANTYGGASAIPIITVDAKGRATTITTVSPATAGTITTVSVVSANGFAGSVANPTSTPAITLTTTVNGLIKGNGTNMQPAVSGTDYGTLTAINGDLSASGTGTVTGTLATVNSNVGSFGSATAIPTFTVNGKGLVTAAGTVAISAGSGTMTSITAGTNISVTGTASVNPTVNVTPAGSRFNIQYNRGNSGLDGAAMVNIDTVEEHLALVATTVNPAASQVGQLKPWADNMIGVERLRSISSFAGVSNIVQNYIGQKRIGIYLPGSAAGAGHLAFSVGFNISAPSNSSFTTTGKSYDATNLLPNFTVVRFICSINQNAPAYSRASTISNCTLMGATANGGGGVYATFTWGLGNYTAGTRFFAGYAALTTPSVTSTADPSAMINMMGVGYDIGDNSMYFMVNDGSGTATKTSILTPNVNDVYRLSVFIPPVSTIVYMLLEDITHSSTTYYLYSSSSNIPAAGTVIGTYMWISSGAVAGTQARYDLIEQYEEQY